MSIYRVIKKFGDILSGHQKFRILELGIMMVVAGFMELLSVSLIVPFVKTIMAPDDIMMNKYVQLVCTLLGIDSHRTFLVFLSFLLALLYIVKNIYLLLQTMIQYRFVNSNMFAAQRDMLRSYLTRPYEFYLTIQSGEVLRIIGNDTAKAFDILINILSMVSECIVSVFLSIAVFLIAPDITIILSIILLLAVILIQKILRPVLKKAGDTYRSSMAEMNQWLIQAIQGIKEVKVMRKEIHFQKRYESIGNAYVKSTYREKVLGLIPRFTIEAVAMSSTFLIIGFMIYKGGNMDMIVPKVSAIAMAAVRLLPSVNRISLNMGYISFGEGAVDNLINNLLAVRVYEEQRNECLNNLNEKIKDVKSNISLDAITYRYPTGDRNVLDNTGFTIRKGKSVGIVGASGAGKTTVIDILLGLLKPVSGSVRVDGTDIEYDMNGWLRNIGYIPQSIFMLDGTIRENVAFGFEEDEINMERVWKALEDASLADFVRDLPMQLDTEIGERGTRLSGGQRQRIGIARALYNNPEVLVFDEATSALDNETEKAIMESIEHLQGNKTIIIVAHRLTTIESCDEIYRVEAGKIIKER